MTHQGLGEFEQLVLLAIVHLRGEAYGIPIVEEIERRTVRADSRGRTYAALWYWREALSFGARFALDRLRRSVRAAGSIRDATSADARGESATPWLDSVGTDIRFALRMFARRRLSS